MTVPSPVAAVGDGQAAAIETWAVARWHEHFFQYTVVYIWQSFFTSGYIFLAQSRFFRDRLPYYPIAYRTTFQGGQGLNDDAVSAHIAGTRHYHEALADDRGFEYHGGGGFSITLESRINGRWALFEGDVLPGTLCAILRVASGRVGGPFREVYVFDTTGEARFGLFDYGKFTTNEVQPDIRLFEGPEYGGW